MEVRPFLGCNQLYQFGVVGDEVTGDVSDSSLVVSLGGEFTTQQVSGRSSTLVEDGGLDLWVPGSREPIGLQ